MLAMDVNEEYGYWPCPKQGYADPSPISFDTVFMKDAQRAESNEKSIF